MDGWNEWLLKPLFSVSAVWASLMWIGYKKYKSRLDDSKFPKELINNDWAQKMIRDRHYFNVILVPMLELKWKLTSFLGLKSALPIPQQYINLRRKLFSSLVDDQTIQEGVRIEVEMVDHVKCYIFTPLKSTSGEALKPNCIFWYHGGGWCVCSVGGSYMQLLQTLCKKFNMTIISPEYRLAPEHPMPAGFDDCYTATERLVQKYSLKDYILTGDSAGGNLCTSVAVKLALNHGDDEKFGKPAVLAPVYPAYQPSLNTKSMIEEDWPSLTRNAVACYQALSACGTFTDDLLDDILNDRHLSLLDEPWTAKYCRFQGDKYPVKFKNEMKCKDQAILAKCKSAFNNPHIMPLLNTDETLETLLNFCKGIYVLVCDHDTIRDDGLIFMERLEGLNEAGKCNLKSWNVKHGYHTLFSSGYYARPKAHQERTENDDVIDVWCDTIVDEML